jgi:hypothetical protein
MMYKIANVNVAIIEKDWLKTITEKELTIFHYPSTIDRLNKDKNHLSLVRYLEWRRVLHFALTLHWMKIFIILLLLPNPDRIQQVDDYVRGCTRQLKKGKIIYSFQKLVYNVYLIKETSSLNIFNRTTQDTVREKSDSCLCWVYQWSMDNERWWVLFPWLS